MTNMAKSNFNNLGVKKSIETAVRTAYLKLMPWVLASALSFGGCASKAGQNNGVIKAVGGVSTDLSLAKRIVENKVTDGEWQAYEESIREKFSKHFEIEKVNRNVGIAVINLTRDEINSIKNKSKELVVNGTVAASDVSSIVEWVFDSKNPVDIQLLFSSLVPGSNVSSYNTLLPVSVYQPGSADLTLVTIQLPIASEAQQNKDDKNNTVTAVLIHGELAQILWDEKHKSNVAIGFNEFKAGERSGKVVTMAPGLPENYTDSLSKSDNVLIVFEPRNNQP
ncbi:MAG: hypothetical protein NZO16_07220 [Deltaproteobacteria bacterium]|nr:hypothetical protein [Deltaproteobacteria bacterium]